MVHLSAEGKQTLNAFIDGVGHDPSTPPFVFAATTADGEIYSRGMGFNRVGDSESGLVDIDSVFWICSQSKMITHLAALQLIEAGTLSLNDPVSKYLPEFNKLIVIENFPPPVDISTAADMAPVPPLAVEDLKYHPATKIMTVEHLLTYTSGLFYPFDAVPDWNQDIDNAYSAPQDATDPAGGFVKVIKNGLPGIPLKFEPGTDWTYGYSSDILGFVIEKVAGKSLEVYMKESIFDPLGMTRTSFYQSPHIKEKKIEISYRRHGDGLFQPWGHRIYEDDPDKVFALYGGANLLTSTRDYLTLLRHYLQIHSNTLPPDVKPIISRDTLVSKIFQPALSAQGKKSLETMLGPIVANMGTGGIQWGYGGMALAMGDWVVEPDPSMAAKMKLRKEGSAFWSGFLNTTHFIDPSTGVAAVFQAQMLPPLDPVVLRTAGALEGVLYQSLVDGQQALDSFIDGAVQDPSIPPFVFAATTADGEIYSRGTGFNRVGDSASGPVDIDSVFWICSQSKMITHLAALQLIEAGNLLLEDPVSKYLPEFDNLIVIDDLPSHVEVSTKGGMAPTPSTIPPVPKSVKYHPATNVMTVEHLMTFTSGISYSSSGTVVDWDKDIENAYTAPQDKADPVGGFIKDIKKGLPGIPLKFEPGTDWAYGYSSDILGFVIEKATGQSLEIYMHVPHYTPSSERCTVLILCVPLLPGKKTSSIHSPWDHRFYEEDPDKCAFSPALRVSIPYPRRLELIQPLSAVFAFYGGAYLLASARDYLTLLRHLLQLHSNTLPPNVKPIVSRDTLISKVFAPALSPQSQKSIEDMLGPIFDSIETGGIQWGYGGTALALGDWMVESEGTKKKLRKAGSAFWFGFLNTSHFIDPSTGVAAVLQVQTLPPYPDQSILKIGRKVDAMPLLKTYHMVLNTFLSP
ncbi:hypothetical protein EST38_g8378 [Candolleomyces aberdarensis]|uniref:Beta-lactamase-related domain-containing protein n=1 Tax=Candolleomyces aberdarensis TaxID=2316362 RepID=A0A4Q2DCU0_9AGAR|nr:hypothetical protein EST38_g8378 [Candolleomyces aberdarensis]